MQPLIHPRPHLLRRLAAPALLLAAALLPLLAACDKTPINGDLDGMWQLVTVQTPQGTRQMQQQGSFMSIQLHMAEWWCPLLGDRFHIFSHFRHEGDSLLFLGLYHASRHTVEGSDDIPVTADEMEQGLMDAWGIHTLHTRYRVRHLTSRHLTLEKEDTVYEFRKF